MNRPTVAEFKAAKKLPIVVVLDDVRSLSNVGSIFRTCDAFLVRKLVLCGITGRPPHRDIQKTALGATESVDWEYREDILEVVEEWKNRDYQIIPVEQCSGSKEPAEALNNVEQVCLVMGNEVVGVRDEVVALADAIMEIPQSGTKHSLNVSVAAGVALWEAFRRF